MDTFEKKSNFWGKSEGIETLEQHETAETLLKGLESKLRGFLSGEITLNQSDIEKEIEDITDHIAAIYQNSSDDAERTSIKSSIINLANKKHDLSHLADLVAPENFQRVDECQQVLMLFNSAMLNLGIRTGVDFRNVGNVDPSIDLPQ